MFQLFKARPAMGLEALERREVPAVALVNGVLHITGTPGRDDIALLVDRFGGFALQVYRASPGPLPVVFPAGVVQRVVVDLGAGDDELKTGGDPGYFPPPHQPMTVFGRGGNDVIDGGSGPDFLYGGPGGDTLFGDDGHDGLDGGPGNDKVFGMGGNDAHRCGDGDDEAGGGIGHDGFAGGAGADRLKGGPGHDRMFGGPGADVLDGEAGNDILYGGAGPDTLTGGPGADVFLFQPGDTVSDYGPADARIDFADGRRRWTEAEVMAVEVGVNALLKATGTTAALRRPNGTEYTFLRHGIRAGGEVVGNNLQGTVLFIDRVFTNLAQPAWRFTILELGRD